MKIGFFGDSWTNGCDVEKHKSYPYIVKNNLGCDIRVHAIDGADNKTIETNVENYLHNYDYIIIGWSGISRYSVNNKSVSLSLVYKENTEEREHFFDNHDLISLQSMWNSQLDKVEKLCKSKNKKLIHYSIFGDTPIQKYENFLEISFLEFIGMNQNGNIFEYDIPIFEFDFLHYTNNIVAREFCNTHLNNNWKEACVEREELRMHQPRKNFMQCGHPTENGHRIWGDFITHKIKEKEIS